MVINFQIELTKFPRIAIFNRKYNEPRSGEIELRQQAQYFGVDYDSVRATFRPKVL